MALLRQHSTRIDITNGHVDIDAEAAAGLPIEGGSIELGVIGFANFMSGTYQQNSSDVTDITSTVTINSDQVKKASFALLTSLPSDSGASFSSYGNTVKATGSKLVINSASALNKDDDSGTVTVLTSVGAWFPNLRLWQGNLQNVLDGINVKKSQGIGAVLVQAAGAALFKSLGKNAAINNDTVVEGKQSNLASAIDTAISENAQDYTNSTMFKRYLDSGRYADDNADVGAAQAYNFKNANLDFVVQLSGTLSDSSNNATLTNAVVNRVLGTSGTDHKVALSDKSYKMNIFVRLQQRDDL